MIGPSRTRERGAVFRIRWLPGSDTLHGTCHCGAQRVAEEPVELWDWLLAHPAGHRGRPAPAPRPFPPARREAPA